jgi:UDP-GlcNAc:undecaprenyl-phosphate GlcNAc-1-phosphate transferase
VSDLIRPLLPPLLASFAASVCLTPVVRLLARRFGLLAQPVSDRWHRHPVPLLGGIAIAAAVAVGILTVAGPTRLGPLLLYSGLMFALGFADDLRRLRPLPKLCAQLVITALFLALVPAPPLTGVAFIDAALAVIWLVGIPNAFNLLDNMDGLAAGVAVIAGVCYLGILLPAGDAPLTAALCAFAGAVGGFLIYNFQPATIFMGDGGSFFIGSFLAGAAVLADGGPRTGSIAAVPILILLIPILDTTFVTLTRRWAGRSPFAGGRDHTSHRIVGLGVSERTAILASYAFAAAGGGVALVVQRIGLAHSIPLVGLYLTILLAAGVILGHVEAAQGTSGSAPLISELTYRNRSYEVALDAALVVIAYYTALRLRFQEPMFSAFLPYFTMSLPIVIGCQVGALWLSGKYRQVWRSVGAAEILSIVRGIAFGVAASVIVLVYLYRFEGFSRIVFLIDAAALSFLLIGSRVAIASIDDHLRRERTRGRNVLIYGAGGAGALLLREVQQNRELGLTPVGFIDDDPQKWRLRLDGVAILGGVSDLPDLIGRLRVEQVLLAARNLPAPQMSQLLETCRERGVTVRRMRFGLDDVDLSGRPTIHVVPHAS